MITVGTCMGCGGLRERGLVDVSTMADLEPVYLAGRWDGCCGWPVQTECRSIRFYDVPVPTPEDLLREAGLWVGLP